MIFYPYTFPYVFPRNEMLLCNHNAMIIFSKLEIVTIKEVYYNLYSHFAKCPNTVLHRNFFQSSVCLELSIAFSHLVSLTPLIWNGSLFFCDTGISKEPLPVVFQPDLGLSASSGPASLAGICLGNGVVSGGGCPFVSL